MLVTTWVGDHFPNDSSILQFRPGGRALVGVPENNEGSDGAWFCTAGLVLAVETKALGEGHDNHLCYGQEREGSHRVWRWNVRVIFAVIVTIVGRVGECLVGVIEHPAYISTRRIEAHKRDGCLQKSRISFRSSSFVTLWSVPITGTYVSVNPYRPLLFATFKILGKTPWCLCMRVIALTMWQCRAHMVWL